MPITHTDATTPHIQVPLTAQHIRFTARAMTPIRFGEFKGSALRGALVSVLRRTFCPATRDAADDSLHQSLCPVCRLLSWAGDDEGAGDVRRPYAIEPPLDAKTDYAPGETFTFGVALYGESWALFPYVALAAGGMGEFGVGQKIADSDGQRTRGKFTIEQIEAFNPITGATSMMMAPGDRMVQTQTTPVANEQIRTASERLLEQLAANGNQLTVHFLTPTRITHQGEHTLRQPDFFPFVKQVVVRVLDLCAQHGDGRPTLAGEPFALKRGLYPYADTVQLVADHTIWWDLKGYSSRLERPQVLGGLIGRAVYAAPDWRPLLPWLLWGVSTHVGKNIVKGCGIYQLAANQG